MELDPIKREWKEFENEISWEEYLENRNKSSRELGFKDAYEEYYVNKNKTSIENVKKM